MGRRKQAPVRTERECYAELVRLSRIFCYQAVVREELPSFRQWFQNVLVELDRMEAPEKTSHRKDKYLDLRRAAGKFVCGRETDEDPIRLKMLRLEMQKALTAAEP